MKHRAYRLFAISLTLIVLAAFLMASCSLGKKPSDPSHTAGTSTGASPTPASTVPPEEHNGEGAQEDPIIPSDKRIHDLMDSMTLEEKIGQMLFLAYRWNQDGGNVLEMDDVLEDTLSIYAPGGFVLFSENIESIEQTVALIDGLQAQSKIPLFISVDEEGGLVTRLNKAPELHSTTMPDAYTIGLTNKPEYAYLAARAIGAEISSLGFNMDFAPVADIFSNPENKVIGRRAYGTEPQLVSDMVSKAVAGFSDQNIIPVLKHFPGHGDTAEDTHTGAAWVDHDLERLMSFELIPFQEGIEAGADAVMVAHIILPKLMDDPVPATLSKEVVTGILREKLMFDGVIITDAMEMSAVSAYYEDDEAAVMAVLAGIDMILMPRSVEEAFCAILSAVEKGVITEERIDESVYRILRLKEKYGILDSSIQGPDPELTLGSPEHKALVQEIKNASKKD